MLRLARPQPLHYINGPDILPPPLSPEEEREVFDALAAGSAEARDRLITRNLRLVVYIAKKFETATAGIEDMISIGTIGLIKAVNTFEPNKNIKLATYASRCIENEILMYLRKGFQPAPGCQHRRTAEHRLGRQRAAAGGCFWSVRMPRWVRRWNAAPNRPPCAGRWSTLPPRERRIMELRFGLDGGSEHTQKEVADIIGISQSYISRLEKRILKRLRRELEAAV